MLSALSNILKITELRQKIVFTLIMFAIFRLGTHIPVPGVNPSMIEQLFNTPVFDRPNYIKGKSQSQMDAEFTKLMEG